MENRLELAYGNCSTKEIKEDTASDVIISNTRENWRIITQTLERDNTTLREVSLLTISLPGGRKWQGTIQDFGAIFSAMNNVIADIRDPAHEGLIKNDTRIEIHTALSLLK